MKVEHKDLTDKLDGSVKEREKSNSTYKLSGLRKSGREAVIPVTDVGVRQVWKIHRIKNYIVDKSELFVK